MRGKTIMSCGCEETEERPGVFATYGTHDSFSDGGYGPCIAFAHMCQPCIDRLAAHDAPIFSNEAEADEWLAAQKPESGK